MGPSAVTAEMFIWAKGVGVDQMTVTIRVVAKGQKIPDTWAGNSKISMNKGKEDALK